MLINSMEKKTNDSVMEEMSIEKVGCDYNEAKIAIIEKFL